MMFRLEFRNTAQRQLARIARQNPGVAQDIKDKILWLATNFEDIEKEKMRGHAENSLHSGQFRILYSVNRSDQLIVVEDIDKHDAAYRKLRKR